jgi:hypothetical protein
MGGPKQDVGRFLPDDHGLPFEIASEKLRRAWQCSRCLTYSVGDRMPGKYAKIYAIEGEMLSSPLLCDSVVAWRVMES